MSLQTALLTVLIVVLGATQYALCIQALRDLHRRPRVRGDNKVLWGLVILCVPIGGAITYTWMGPTSFIHRSVPVVPGHPQPGAAADGPPSTPATITPISDARAARRRRMAEAAQTPQPARPKRTPAEARKIGRTGS